MRRFCTTCNDFVEETIVNNGENHCPDCRVPFDYDEIEEIVDEANNYHNQDGDN